MQAGQHVTPTIRLVRPLGEGAMGCVWVAEHLALGTQVAVKLMARDYVQRPEFTVRFQREAQAAARLRSPHVTQVFDHGVTPEGEPFIVMELLEGETLRQRLKRHGHLPIEQVVRLVEQTAKALSRAHQLGIVHRDIKPDNLFLIDEEGEPFVKVLDFGIAKHVHPDVMGMTATGRTLGTPLYMSPEQFSAPKHIDHRTDLWALSVVAYEALTGRAPFVGDTFLALARSVCAGKFPMPSALRTDLPTGVDAWMARALQCDAAQRFESATQMAQAFATSAQRSAMPAPSTAFDDTAPASRPDEPVRPAQRAAPARPLQDVARAEGARGAAEARGHAGKEAAFDAAVLRRLFSRPSSGGERPERDVTPGVDVSQIQITDEPWEDARVLSLSIPGIKPSAVKLGSRGLTLYGGFSLGLVMCWELEARRWRWWRKHLARPLCFARAQSQTAIFLGCSDGNIRAIDAKNGATERTLQGHATSVRCVATSPTGQQLASCSDDKTVRLWNISTGELMFTGKEHSDRVRSVAFSPNGTVLASSANDSTIRLWDQSLRPLRVLRGSPGGVRSVAFSPDGAFLAAGCGDGTIRIWEMGKYEQPVRVLEGHSQRVVSVAFGWRGGVLASGSPDRSVRLWNVATGKPLRVLPRHGGAVESVALSLHGEHLASASDDGMVRVFSFSKTTG
ncbi:WD40 repeat domain-containing serine/threonine protein kinase [Sorangium sp. So ce128]|uniref:WD40 repeat domain-containing serine/threonine protein kinase n=1 Tax=Sorangium sp. So ce128 TaxID=3133281 RepID=UPI003F635BA5